MKIYKSKLRDYKIDTIYFGGGTPSMLKLKNVEKIFDSIGANTSIETTFELNPESCDKEYLNQLKKLGVNRISLGVQNFDDSVLKYLGRIHDSKRAKKCISDISDIFDNYSIDIIYGINGIKYEIKKSIDFIIENDIKHVSTYPLEVYQNTPMSKIITNYEDDKAINDFKIIYELLLKNGYKRYEISNFSKDGMISRHNNNYWLLNKYIGLGVGASGYLNTRYTNIKDINKYIELLENSILPIDFEEKIDLEEQKKEYIIFRLRLYNGIDIREYNNRFNEEFLVKYKCSINKNIKANFLELKNDRIYLTYQGFMFMNKVLLDFI